MHAQDRHIFYTVNLYHGEGTTSVLFRKIFACFGGRAMHAPTFAGRFVLWEILRFAQNDRFVRTVRGIHPSRVCGLI